MNEGRLKLYRPCQEYRGQAPVILEAARRPNMKEATGRKGCRPREEKREPRVEWQALIEPEEPTLGPKPEREPEIQQYPSHP